MSKPFPHISHKRTLTLCPPPQKPSPAWQLLPVRIVICMQNCAKHILLIQDELYKLPIDSTCSCVPFTYLLISICVISVITVHVHQGIIGVLKSNFTHAPQP